MWFAEFVRCKPSLGIVLTKFAFADFTEVTGRKSGYRKTYDEAEDIFFTHFAQVGILTKIAVNMGVFRKMAMKCGDAFCRKEIV